MPIYEYYAPENNRIYSFYAKTPAGAEKVPRCPDNPRYKMEKMISGFSVTGRKSESREAADPLGDDLDDPRMESAMAELEREMAGMDENNPDPRQMGRLMRRMAEMSGEKMPPSMEEMIRRLETGEDPEKLEEEFGDLLDEEMPEGDTGFSAGGGGTKAKKFRKIAPTRDPVLHDMEDYL